MFQAYSANFNKVKCNELKLQRIECEQANLQIIDCNQANLKIIKCDQANLGILKSSQANMKTIECKSLKLKSDFDESELNHVLKICQFYYPNKTVVSVKPLYLHNNSIYNIEEHEWIKSSLVIKTVENNKLVKMVVRETELTKMNSWFQKTQSIKPVEKMKIWQNVGKLKDIDILVSET